LRHLPEYISRRFLDVVNTKFTGNGDGFKQFESVNPDAFLGYVLVIFMVFGSLVIAKKVANKGSGMVSGAITTGAGIGLGTASINASALFQMDSTTKGFLPPRMTAAQRGAISAPAQGLIIFQVDGVIGLYIYANSTWRTLGMI
jgi:hypothetical protein